ncbi:hypothetical protein D3C85_1280380 [compost metagenome]
MSPSQVFGSEDRVAIGKKLSEQYPAEEGFESGFRFNRALGRLEHVTFGEDGREVKSEWVQNPQKIGAAIQTDKEAVVTEARNAHFGAPITVSGQQIEINGDGSYGVPVRTVYNFRKELAEMEGLNTTVYKDRNGLAVGLGRNVTGRMKEGDTITIEQAEDWFRDDTDRALGIATRVAKDLGVRDTVAVTGLAGALYQLGAEGFSKHERTAEAIRNHDYNAFVQEVRSSAWAQQTPKRAEWFITKMAGHFLP